MIRLVNSLYIHDYLKRKDVASPVSNLMLREITQKSLKYGFCYATNKKINTEAGYARKWASKNIGILRNKKFIISQNIKFEVNTRVGKQNLKNNEKGTRLIFINENEIIKKTKEFYENKKDNKDRYSIYYSVQNEFIEAITKNHTKTDRGKINFYVREVNNEICIINPDGIVIKSFSKEEYDSCFNNTKSMKKTAILSEQVKKIIEERSNRVESKIEKEVVNNEVEDIEIQKFNAKVEKILDEKRNELSEKEKAEIINYFQIKIMGYSNRFIKNENIQQNINLMKDGYDFEFLMKTHWKISHEDWSMGMTEKFKKMKIDYVYRKLKNDINKDFEKKFSEDCKYTVEVTQEQKEVVEKLNYLLDNPIQYERNKRKDLSKNTRANKRGLITEEDDPEYFARIKRQGERELKALLEE